MSVDTSALGANSIIRNTVTNRNTIAPVLYSICTNNNAPIVVDPEVEHDLTGTDVYQAVCLQNGQPVSITGSGTGYICVGPDTAEKALEWMTHLNILEVDRLVVMQFYLTQTFNDPFTVMLGNTIAPATFDHIQIQVNGSTGAADGILFDPDSCAGNRVMVEVSCLDNTPGSELVSFNVLYGPSWDNCDLL